MQFDLAPDIQKRIREILGKLDLPYIDATRVICFRSTGSSSRARARIWSFPTIWQKALRIKPHYALEVLGEKFDHLHNHDQTRVLIHELMHIPKNFSGALLPHRGRGNRRIDHLTVEQLFRQYRAHR
jgi:predicted metallopeptidase